MTMATAPVLVILAGGVSSRMWPLAEKSLLRFGRETLMASQLRRYQELGFRRGVIIANPENIDDIRALAAQFGGLDLEVVVQPEALGIGDALLQIEQALADDPQQPIYVNQVHDVVDMALHQAMLEAHVGQPDATFLAGKQVSEYFPGGYLEIGPQDQITRIIEKPGAGREPSDLVTLVAHLHAHADVLLGAIRHEYTRDHGSDDHYERAMASLMQGHPYRVVRYGGPWCALKFPWHTLNIMDYYLSQIKGQRIHETAFIAPTATVLGDVVIEAGARIFPGAAVVGPAYIGEGTVVGNNALVRGSMVLDRCEVGFTTEVARSYVAEGVAMHACRVLDSVLAPGVNFSAGCTTANLRIDHGEVSSMVKGARTPTGRDKFGAVIGAGAFVGVDVMTMPGVKIGAGAQVGPGVHVHQDVPDRTRIYVRQDLVVKPLD
jgi:UDP-N-acetylglucosamine diphosphorylase / glucose-1-phosphate thymidylyltransferase / UDP-N-acetylgalactosamine diphosphorylase / glucosamine-1-phosphate N-acetyltransferase / galactosamine-1-phosphate N-acetyltransferase